jgi:hypothetical protein
LQRVWKKLARELLGGSGAEAQVKGQRKCGQCRAGPASGGARAESQVGG